MKTWQFWVIIIMVIFVVVPLIVYGISVSAASKVVASNPNLVNNAIANLPHLDASGYASSAPPQK